MPAGFDKVWIEVRANEYAPRDRNPHVPWSPEEIASDAAACREAGAAILHYHARDPDTGAPAWDASLYAETIRRARAACDLLINPTLGAVTVPDPAKRVAHIPVLAQHAATRPDLAPVDLGSFNIDPWLPEARRFAIEDLVYVTSVAGLRHVTGTIERAGVKPQAVLWSVGGARCLAALRALDHFAAPVTAQLTLSDALLSAHPGTVKGLAALADFVPENVSWSVNNAGGNLFPVVTAAVERGGNVAIGLGDHAYPELGKPTNAELVAEVARLVRACGKEVATPAEVREALGLAA